MKTKLVLWGQKGIEDVQEKVLLALELNPEANKVKTWVFEGNNASEEFSKELLNKWRQGQAVAFPEGVEATEQALSASSSLLPEDVKADKQELLTRTQTEWIFMVLSTKLYQTYRTELDELQEKVDSLNNYSKDIWNTMKSFWDKVQQQINEQNLFREHINTLRGRTNELFAQLKTMRSKEDSQYEEQAEVSYKEIVAQLEPIEAQIRAEKTDLQKLFNGLKDLQQRFKNATLTRSLRSKLWDRIDAAFKEVKKKRSPNSSPEGRLTRRMEGLLTAIQKMERSIGRDEKEMTIQKGKLNSGNVSQLETQLREVRAKLIQERIDSKNNKLQDMRNTMKDLENKQKKNAARREREEKREAEREKKRQAQKAAEEKRAAEKAAAKAIEEENSAKEPIEVPPVEPTIELPVEEITIDAKDETPVTEPVDVPGVEPIKEPIEVPGVEPPVEETPKDEEE
ncbi:MAG: hypothetical protein ACRBFS_05220 [Aureispira sp.]